MKNCFVLIYHRIQELGQDPQSLAVHPERFEQQIQYLKNRFTIISLQEMVRRISAGESIENVISITFDDGYADNLYYAKPILEKYRAPATFFITTGMIGSGREFWWDELERIFLVKKKSLKPLIIKIDGKEYNWNIYDRNVAREVYYEIHRLLKYLPGEKRESIMDELFSWVEVERNKGREINRVLNRREILQLAGGDLVEIGSHTLTHPVLSVEAQETQRQEINDSRIHLEQIIGRKITSFSYPFGQKNDITPETVRMVKQSGYTCGISNIQGNIDDRTDCFMIPRRIIRNWEIDDFRQNLDKFLDVNKSELGKKIKIYLDNIKSWERKCSPNERERKIQNILFINHYDWRGGAAKVCYRIFENLEKKGFGKNILVKKRFFPHQDVNEFPDIDSDEQKCLTAFQENEGWLDVFHYSSFNIKRLGEFQNADVVHLHNLQKEYFSLLALPEITCLKPVIWTLHDMFAFTGHCSHSYECSKWETGCGNCPHLTIEPKVNKDHTDLLWNLKKIVYEYSDFTVVCPSNWLKSKLERSILKDKEIKLIYNGVDEAVFNNYHKNEARERLNLPKDKLILLFVAYGGLGTKIKGGHLIGHILERLPKENILFLSIGNVIMNPGYLKALPYIDDEKQLAFYYAAADLLIYPSLADNCPLVVLESLSCGTPVITFNTGGIPELVKHKETGYIAEYNNIIDLINGVEFFMKNPGLLKKMAGNARESILKGFTLKEMIKKYLELYEAKYRDFCTTPHTIDENYKTRIEKLLS